MISRTTKLYRATSPHRNEKWFGKTLCSTLPTNDPPPTRSGHRRRRSARRARAALSVCRSAVPVGEPAAIRRRRGTRRRTGRPLMLRSRRAGRRRGRSRRWATRKPSASTSSGELRQRPGRRAADRAGAVERVEHRLVARADELAQRVGRAVVDAEQPDRAAGVGADLGVGDPPVDGAAVDRPLASAPRAAAAAARPGSRRRRCGPPGTR